MRDEKQNKIPKLYGTDNIPTNQKIIHQKYDIKSVGFYWLIAELDPKENLAYGYANLNDDYNAEWGYISIDEIVQNDAIQDQSWKPIPYKNAIKIVEKQREERRSFYQK